MPRRTLATRNTSWAKLSARWLGKIGVRPNAVSIAGVGFAIGAAIALFSAAHRADGSRAVLLLIAAASIQLRLLCNLLDGMLAVEGGFKTPTGEIYNELPDRIADLVVLAAAGYSAPSVAYAAALGWLAATLALLTAYVRVFAGSLGVTQHFIGPMAKQHRMFLLTVAAIAAAGETFLGWPSRAIPFGLAIIAAGCIITMVRRTCRLASEVNTR